MPLPARYTVNRYALAELAGAGFVFILLLIKLSGRYIGWDWLLDTTWFITAAWLVGLPFINPATTGSLPAWSRAPWFLLLCVLFLFLFHLMGVVLMLKYASGINLLLYLAATVSFGIALYFRAGEFGIHPAGFTWMALFRFPQWPLTAGLLGSLLGLFMKITKFPVLLSNYGLQFNYSAEYGWGYNNWGYNFYQSTMLAKGYFARFGRAATLLILILICLHIVHTTGKKPIRHYALIMKAGLVVFCCWWLLAAKGYEAMGAFGNILLLLAMIIWGLAAFVPDMLAGWLRPAKQLPGNHPADPPPGNNAE